MPGINDMDFSYNEAWRMDWGLGNPNKTATLIACLMIAVWSIPLARNRGFWLALVLFNILAVCLVATYSRGGVVALVAGIAVLLPWIPRPWPRSRWIGIVTSLWVLGAFILYAKAQARYGQGMFSQDDSIHNRLVIWKQVPQMMAAAPWGWGFGKAGDAYTQWFQSYDQSQNYLNLINSHFNFMVEGGWLASFCYIFVWLAVFLFCWPLPFSRFKAVPLAIWTAFGVGGCFTHVEESCWLWLLSLVALGYVFRERLRTHQWPSLSGFLFGGAVSAGTVIALIWLGVSTTSQPIKFSNGVVTVGEGPAKTVVFVDRQVVGSLFGHTFRKYVAENPDLLRDGSFEFIESGRTPILSPVDCLVISGRCAGKSGTATQIGPRERIVLVNPTCFPDEAQLSPDVIKNATVFFGEYSQSPSRSSWLSERGVKSVQIVGASDFVPSWPAAIWNFHKT